MIFESGNYSSILVSFFCIGIIIFIFFTQCKISKIKLQMKDASLILIFLALLSYINGYNICFFILLISFIIIYFSPDYVIDRIFSRFLKKEKKIKKTVTKIVPKMVDDEKTYTTDNEITLDTEIGDLDDIVEEEIIIKKKNE